MLKGNLYRDRKCETAAISTKDVAASANSYGTRQLVQLYFLFRPFCVNIRTTPEIGKIYVTVQHAEQLRGVSQ